MNPVEMGFHYYGINFNIAVMCEWIQVEMGFHYYGIIIRKFICNIFSLFFYFLLNYTD